MAFEKYSRKKFFAVLYLSRLFGIIW